MSESPAPATSSRRWTYFPLHTILLSVGFIFALYVNNIATEEIHFASDVLPALAVSLGAAAVLWFLLAGLCRRDPLKTSLFLSLSLALFYTFGHAYDLVCKMTPIRYRTMYGVYLLIFVVGSFLIIRTRRPMKKFNQLLNFVTSAWMAILVVSLLLFGSSASGGGGEQADVAESGTASAEGRPDLFYLIVDGYARNDVLKGLYDFDNREMESFLRGKGFWVPSDSRSNYMQTSNCIPSVIKMDYVNEYYKNNPDAIKIKSNPDIKFPLYSILKKQGYRVVANNSDHLPDSVRKQADFVFPFYNNLNEFLQNLLKTSALRIVGDRLLEAFYSEDMRLHVPKTFAELRKQLQSSDPSRPKAILAHIWCPHPPFLFGPDGKAVPADSLKVHGNSWANRKGYVDQLNYLNGELTSFIQEAMARENPPMILIHSDHGTASTFCLSPTGQVLSDTQVNENWNDPTDEMIWERSAIFAAVYWPGIQPESLPDRVTALNLPRLLLQQALGVDLSPLQDKTYYSSYDQRHLFREVTEILDRKNSP